MPPTASQTINAAGAPAQSLPFAPARKPWFLGTTVTFNVAATGDVNQIDRIPRRTDPPHSSHSLSAATSKKSFKSHATYYCLVGLLEAATAQQRQR